jgi:hypothetical protein
MKAYWGEWMCSSTHSLIWPLYSQGKSLIPEKCCVGLHYQISSKSFKEDKKYTRINTDTNSNDHEIGRNADIKEIESMKLKPAVGTGHNTYRNEAKQIH